MARIQQYKTDTTITGGDKLVGNDAADNSTKLFQISDIAAFFAKEGIADGAKIGYQFNYGGKYANGTIDSGNIEYDVNPTAPSQFNWANIDKIAISTESANSADISNVLPFMLKQNIKVTDILNDTVDNFAVFNVTAIEDVTGGKVFSVTLKASSGNPTANNIVLAPFGFASPADIGALSTDDVVDNLTSTDATKVLSAAQGKILKDLIDVINAAIASNDPSLDTIQEIVDYIKTNNANIATNSTNISALQTGKVDKVAGKQLSEEDFTSNLLAKLNSIADNAEVNVQADWAQSDSANDAFIQNKPTDVTDLSAHDVTELNDVTNAGSGAIITSSERTKLTGIATGAEVNVQADYSESDSNSDAFIQNKPTITVAGTSNEVEVSPTGAQNLPTTFTIGLPNDVTIGEDLKVNETIELVNAQSSTPTFDNGLYYSTEDNHDTLHFRYHGHDLSIDYLTENIPTGILNGGELSTNTATTFDVAAGDGVINILNKDVGDPHPEIKKVAWSATTVTHTLGDAGDTDQLNTWIYVDSTGTIQQTLSIPSPSLWRNNIVLGSVIHSENVIRFVKTFPRPAYSNGNTVAEFIEVFGPLKKSGHLLTVNSSNNMRLDRSAGISFALGRNYETDAEEPNLVTDSASTPVFHRYSSTSTGFTKDDGVAGAGYTAIDPTKYDNNGTLTTISSGHYSVQRLYHFPNNTNVIVAYYGKDEYNSMDTAEKNYLLENFQEAENTSSQAIYLGALIVKGNTTDLTIAADAKILAGGIFRSLSATNLGGVAADAVLNDLNDVTITSLQNGQVIQYNNTTGQWENATISISSTLSGLTDVTISNVANNQVLKYNSSTGNWENATDAGGIALTDLSMASPASASGSGDVSYNNTTGEFTYTPPDLSSYIDGTGSANKIAFWTDADTLSNDTSLHWDSSNNRLGIGVTSPIDTLEVNGAIKLYSPVYGNSRIGRYYGDTFFDLPNTSSKLSVNRLNGSAPLDSNLMPFAAGTIGVGTMSASVSIDAGSKTDAIKLPNGTTAQRPTPAAGMLRYNTTDGQFEGYTTEWGPIGGGGGSSTITRDSFSGNGSTTGFTLSSAISDEANTQVYIDGVYQSKLNYSIAGNVVTFSTAPHAGTNNIEVINVAAVTVEAASGLNKNTFTGDGSTTGFTLSQAPTSEDFTFVFIQGVYQEKSTYVVAGSTITFSTAPQNNYTVEVMHLGAVNVQQSSYMEYDAFTGTGSQTAFTLVNGNPTDEKFTMVFIQGVYQEKSTYSLSGTTINFATAPDNTYTIEIMSVSSGGILTNPSTAPLVSVISSSTTAVSNSVYVLTANLTLTLPANPGIGDSIKISNRSGVATCVLGANNKKIMGSAANLTLDTASASFELIYSGTEQGWVIIGQ